MAFIKSSAAVGKRQAPIPGPNSAAYRKVVAGKKNGAKRARGAAGKPCVGKERKRPRSTTAFASLKARQRLVERLKREIWASVLKINEAIINLALAGNFNAAKALFDFAGVYSLPAVEDEEASTATAGATATEPAAQDPVDAFFRSIGVPPSCAEPEPGVAVTSL